MVKSKIDQVSTTNNRYDDKHENETVELLKSSMSQFNIKNNTKTKNEDNFSKKEFINKKKQFMDSIIKEDKQNKSVFNQLNP